MLQYKISYIVTTYNKFDFLKEVLSRLVIARQPDEEIIVCDGGSNDGTSEYLKGLFEAGKIQQFVSERDLGESHGFNKGMLLAKGDILKIVTDDDAFNYPVIRKAAQFMQEHPEIEVVVGYNAALLIEDMTFARIKEEPANDFKKWLITQEPFHMIGLPLLIRRSALPHTGLFAVGIVLVDLDFTYRITSTKVKIAWCTGLLSMHVSHPGGNFNRMSLKARNFEYNRIKKFYTKPKIKSLLELGKDYIEATKRPLRPTKRAFFERMGWPQYQNPERFETGYRPRSGESNLSAAYRVCDEFLAQQNNRPVEFIY